MTVWRDSIAKANAVDMMDYADSLTTMPTAKAADTATHSVIDEGRRGSPSN